MLQKRTPSNHSIQPRLELLYRVDESDAVLGSVDRREAHTKNLLHRSGIVFLIRSDRRILLQRRSPNKETFPDCYDTSASFHVTLGESYEEAAKRELKEETNISGQLEYLSKFVHHDPPEHQIVAIFVCRNDDPVTIDGSEAVSADFNARTEVESIVSSKKITPWLRDGWKLIRERI